MAYIEGHRMGRRYELVEPHRQRFEEKRIDKIATEAGHEVLRQPPTIVSSML